MLAPGEMFPTARLQEDAVEGTPMEGLEHLGQYVYEMTQAKVKALGEENVLITDGVVDGDDEDAVVEDEIMQGAVEEDLTV
jgi:intron-binding protein aquarius